MSQKHLRRRDKESLELIEEAVGLVRRAPVSHLAIYCIGALPFVLGTLYFWAEMSRSPFAEQHLVGETLGLGLLYLWMKTCQTAFSRCIRCQVSGESFTFSPARLWRVFLVQAAVQPTGLFLLPVSLVLAVPFPWVYAFYQNLTVLDDGEELDIRSLVKDATGQALVWPRQNHFLLLVIGSFGFFICLNVMTAFFVLPSLVKMLFGIETVFTRSGLSLLNSTFFAATLALAYLCIDPVLKTIYALRCFYAESRNSGADLKAELHRSAAAPSAAVTAMLVLLLVCGSRTFGAQQTSADASFVEAQAQRQTDGIGSQVPSAELDQQFN